MNFDFGFLISEPEALTLDPSPISWASEMPPKRATGPHDPAVQVGRPAAKRQVLGVFSHSHPTDAWIDSVATRLPFG